MAAVLCGFRGEREAAQAGFNGLTDGFRATLPAPLSSSISAQTDSNALTAESSGNMTPRGLKR